MTDLVQQLVALEADVRYQEAARPGEAEFAYEPGPGRILLSAPHAAVHTRQGAPKEEDDFTAGLARLLARQTGAHVLYLRRRSASDPNWDRQVPYKATLAQIVETAGIRFVLDLHGAAYERPFGLALGTLRGQSCPDERERLIASLADHGFAATSSGLDRLDLDQRYTAVGKTGQHTVTRFAWETLGVPAAQIEINEGLRVAARRPDASREQHHIAGPGQIAHVLAALRAAIEAVQ